jgi:AcrR family transcriptional regulator
MPQRVTPGRPGNGQARPLRADARRNRAAILAAAEAVFAQRGTSASTEEVATRAGVAVGTVFRHFPTKDALLRAMMKDLLSRLASEAQALIRDGDPATALFTFFARVVEQAAARKTVADLLASEGIGLEAGGPLATLRQELHSLLRAAQQAGSVRQDVAGAEVMALLAATSDAALRSGWDHDLQRRTLAIVFSGLRPASPGVTATSTPAPQVTSVPPAPLTPGPNTETED